MEYRAKIVQQSFNIFKKYLQQHLTHSYHLRPMIQHVKLHNVKTHNEELFGIEIGTHRALNAYSIMQNLPIRKLQNVRLKRHNIKTKRKNIGESYYGLINIRARRSTNLNRKISGWIEGIYQHCGVV